MKKIYLFFSLLFIAFFTITFNSCVEAKKAKTYWVLWDVFEPDSYDWSDKHYKDPGCSGLFDEEIEDPYSEYEHNHDWVYMKTKKGYKQYECMNCFCIKCVPIKNAKITKGIKLNAKKIVSKYLKAAKKYNWKKMNKCFAKKKSKTGYPTKKEVSRCYKTINKKLKWKILNVSSKGKKYSVKVKVTMPNLYSKIYNKMLYDLYYYEDKALIWSSKKMGKKIADGIEKVISKNKNKTKTITKTIIFPVKKTKKGWKITKKTTKLVDIATARFASAFNEAYDTYKNY